MPMVLLPPPLFSTITGCFRRSPSCWPTTRARMSAPQPAEYGTMTLMGFDGKSCARAPSGRRRAASRLAIRFIVLALVRMRVLVLRAMAMIMIVHQLLRDIGKELARRWRGAADPFDPTLLAGGLDEIGPIERRRIARDLEALGQGGEHKFPHAPSVPSFAQGGELRELFGIGREEAKRRELHGQVAERAREDLPDRVAVGQREGHDEIGA